jgi:hypothetical protein
MVSHHCQGPRHATTGENDGAQVEAHNVAPLFKVFTYMFFSERIEVGLHQQLVDTQISQIWRLAAGDDDDELVEQQRHLFFVGQQAGQALKERTVNLA